MEELVSLLSSVRNGEVEVDSLERSPWYRIVSAICLARKDLSTKQAEGGVYEKYVRELECNHVILWKPQPARIEENLNVSRSAAMARSMIRAYVPRFLVALLDLEECAATRLALSRPECFLECGNYLVMPNPAYYDMNHPEKNVKSPKGFGLVCWWIHPELKKRSRYFNAHPELRFLRRRKLESSSANDASSDRGPALSVSTIVDLAADSRRYLYDVSDLTRADVPELKRLDRAVKTHLRSVYGISASDKDLYFHQQHAMWNSPERAWSMTLHLHVAVRRTRTPSCYCHSVTLADKIHQLTHTKPQHSPAVVPEILDVPQDPKQAERSRRLLRNSGFFISKQLTPKDLLFDDLLGYKP